MTVLGVTSEDPVVADLTLSESANANEITFTLADAITDREDDHFGDRVTNVVIQSLPHESAGTLVKVNGDGTTTPVTVGEVLPETTTLRYIEKSEPFTNASFSAINDFAPVNGTTPVASFTSNSGITLTGGTFSGNAPTGTLIAGTLNYDDQVSNSGLGLGVNGNELDDSTTESEYISIAFTREDVTNVDLSLSSVGGNFRTDGANAVVKVALFKDGVQVGVIHSFDNLNATAQSTNQPVINIDSNVAFDEMRLYIESPTGNSNMLLQSVQVNETAPLDGFEFSAVDTDGNASDNAATVTFNMQNEQLSATDDTYNGVIAKRVIIETLTDVAGLGSATQSTNPSPDTTTRIIDMGVENANKTVTISLDILVKGSWDDIAVSGVVADSFSILSNGVLLETHTYSSYNSDPNNISYDDSWQHNDGTHTYQITLDSQGRANLDFSVISTRSLEVVDITNISATLNTVDLSAIVVDVLPNDETHDQPVTITLPETSVTVGGTVVGTLSVVNKKVLFTPNEQLLTLTEQQLSQLSFDYSISDGNTTASATATINLRVADVTTADVVGSDSNESFAASASAQTINAAGGNDYVEAGAGNDIIFAGNSSSLLDIDADLPANTRALLTNDIDSLVQVDGEQLLSSFASSTVDIVNAGSGEDIVYGEAGSDVIYGHTGNDYIDGGTGNDALRGGLGNDVLLGQNGNDWLVGDDGNDTLIGGNGNDTIIAGLGNDTVIGGLGNDTITSGQGSNTFLWLANELGTDTIENFNLGEDKIDLIDLLGLESNENLEQYLSFNFDNGDTTISVDTNLDGSTNQDIILSDINLTGYDNQTIINTLFTKIDESEVLFSSNSVEETPSNLSNLDDETII